MSIKVLFSDSQILAIHKPPGIPFHSEQGVSGIVQLVREQFGSDRLFPVHRLDKMTSGLMVFAKNSESNKELSHLFELKKIEKYYLAASLKKPGKKQGMVKGDMAKSRNGSFKLTRENTNPAITRFFAKSKLTDDAKAWFFLLKPETGKTHQLRVALKSIGSPIIGDSRYGGEQASRGYLHAYCIKFSLFGKQYKILDEFIEGEEYGINDFTHVFHNLNEPEAAGWPKQAFLL